MPLDALFIRSCLLLLAFCVIAARGATTNRPRELSADGITFAILGEKRESPSPTLFIFATNGAQTLSETLFVECGRILEETAGFLCVSLDLPGHGAQAAPKGPGGIGAWRAAAERNEDFVSPCARRASAVLDYLVREGYTDERRVAVMGISRGGFMAFHFMAREPRVRAAVGISPVTDLPVLTEFAGLEHHAFTRSLAAASLVERLADRSIWISIGNNDRRVGTDSAIAFSRALVQAVPTTSRPAPVVLLVEPSDNHRQVARTHQAAAALIAGQLLAK